MSEIVTLASFGTPSSATGTVTIKGAEIKVRTLSMYENGLLVAAHPAPQPPLVQPPDKGSLAEKEPDETDPDYLAACKLHQRELIVLEAAAAINYGPAPSEVGFGSMTLAQAGKVNRAKDWVKQTLLEWVGDADRPGRFDESDVMTIRKKVGELAGQANAGN